MLFEPLRQIPVSTEIACQIRTAGLGRLKAVVYLNVGNRLREAEFPFGEREVEYPADGGFPRIESVLRLL